MSAVVVGAAELLDLEQTGAGLFRSRHNLDNGRSMNFGGQPLLQGLAAARTAPGWPAHSISSLYLRGGIVAEPVDYAVETLRDGRRFAARRVLASQRGKPVFDMLCSFQDPEDGPRHQASPAPPSPPPDGLEPLAAFVRRNAHRVAPELLDLYVPPFPIELRLIDPETVLFGPESRPARDYWFRMPSAAAVADPLDHQCLLACASDYWFAGAAAAMHYPPGAGGTVAVVTLNHAMWFHASARADGWLLYRTDSPWAGEGRGLVRGSIYDEGGRLVATAAQEISIRRMDAARGGGMTDTAPDGTGAKPAGFAIFRTRDASPDHGIPIMQRAPMSAVAMEGGGRLMAAGIAEGHENRLLFAAPGFSLAYAWFKSGYPLPRHAHDGGCVYYILAGSLRLGTETLGKGDGFFVGAGVPYAYTAGPEGVEVLEFRSSDAFDISVLANNSAFWEKAAGIVGERADGWRTEARPSEAS